MKASCLVTHCERPSKVQGYCNAHWHRVQRGVDLDAPIRTRKAPTGPAKPARCTHAGCDRSYHTKGLCMLHYHRERRGYPMDRPHQRKARKGQRHIGKDGYASVYEPSNPNSRFDGWIFEHRVVMEGVIGRPLSAAENVHHKNGIRDDNRPQNLELWVRTQPAGQRVSDLLAWAREIEATYGPISNLLT